MSEQRFDIRRRSKTGLAFGDPVTAEQTAEAEAYIRAYAGQGKFMLSMQAQCFARGTITRRQVAAVLNCKSQEAGR